MSRMQSFDWRTRQSRRRYKKASQTASRHDRRLRLEPLEDRRLLATFSVTNILDGAVAAPGDLPGSLRQAIYDANNTAGADIIDFDTAGVFATPQTITLGGTGLSITEALTITGTGASQLTINGNNASQVFIVGDLDFSNLFDVEISDLTISGGYEWSGGAIFNREQLTLNNSTVSGNSAEFRGGAVYNFGELTLNSTTLSGNAATYGGGIFNKDTLTVNSSTFTNNLALEGGAIDSDGTATVTGSTISGNSASNAGGGLYVAGGTLTVAHSTITDNSITTAGAGGGIHVAGGATTVEHTILSGNSATTTGNEINVAAGTLTLNDYNLIGDSSQTTAQALNGVSAGANDIKATSDGTNPTALASILITTLADNGGPTLTHALPAVSPALDSGDPLFAGPPSEDQRGSGYPRVTGAAIDIGALEHLPTVYVVDITADESDGNTLPGDLSLREAIELANANPGADIITFDTAGVFATPQTITLGGTELAITDALTITGTGASQLTVNGNNASRVFHIDDGTASQIAVAISDLTISGGAVLLAGTDGGGGILNREQLTISDSTISGNSVQNGGGGGGIDSYGAMTVSSCTISGNTAPFAGGILTRGSATITSSTISGNSAKYFGGGIDAHDSLIITDSTISGNQVTYDGGGLRGSGNITVAGSTINGNSAQYGVGGGLEVRGNLALTNSTISGNEASENGGGIYVGVSGNLTTVNHSTITGNSTTSAEGGGFYVAGGTTTIGHTIVSGNSATTTGNEIHRAAGTVNLDGYNLLGDSSSTTAQAIFGATAGANDITATSDGTNSTALASILNTTLANNGGPTPTHELLAGSPAIDAGDSSLSPPPNFDQRGGPFARFVGSAVDIGAVEVQGGSIALVVDTLDDESDGDYTPGDLSLREALEITNTNTGADTVTFDDSLSGTINLALGELFISDSATVTGLGASTLTIDAGGNSGGLIVSGATVDISGLTISGGNSELGGGIYVAPFATTTLTGMVVTGNSSNNSGGGISNTGDLTITNSTISNNSTSGGAGSGAGIWNLQDLTVIGSTITGNTSIADGGGIGSNASSGGVTIVDSTIANNNAGISGGGLSVSNGTNSIVDSTISDNTAGDDGGGLSVGFGTISVSITGSTISGNTATGDDGGAIWSNGGILEITNSTISGNSAADEGGALWRNPIDNPFVDPGHLTVNHSTISGNEASENGGGIYVGGLVNLTTVNHSTITGNSTTSAAGGGIYVAGGTTTIGHTIVSGNSATTTGNEIHRATGTLNLNDYNLLGHSGQTTAQAINGVSAGVNEITATSDGNTPTHINSILDPVLRVNGGPTLTHGLFPVSPALDGGNPAVASPPTYDQRGAGFNRIVDVGAGAIIDIGAYEAQTLPLNGDLNLDGFVDGADFGILLASFGLTGKGYADGNLNGDPFVDGADIGIMFAAWTGDAGPAPVRIVASGNSSVAPAAQESQVASATTSPSAAELVDAAMAVALSDDTIDEQELYLDDLRYASDAARDQTLSSIDFAPQSQSYSVSDRITANASEDGEQDEASDQWLSDELLEQVFS